MVSIDQLTSPPRIGRSYEVPCLVPTEKFRLQSKADILQFHSEAMWDWLNGIRPVLLPLHEDPQLGVPVNHYHIDLRFCSPLRLQAFQDSMIDRMPPTIEWHHAVDLYTEAHHPSFRLEWLSLNCYRHFPEFVPQPQHKQFYQFLRSFVGKPLECGKCPHRSMNVAALSRLGNQDERVVCPGHGLIIDLKQNRVVGLMMHEVKVTLLLVLLTNKLSGFLLHLAALQLQITEQQLQNSQRCDRLAMELLDQLLPPPPSGQISRSR